jgi:hypothetical protein
MNEQLLKLCGGHIEVLYQRRRGVPAELAWQRLREELMLIAGTEAEQQLLVAAEIARTCRRHNWPVWEAGTGPSSIILFLLLWRRQVWAISAATRNCCSASVPAISRSSSWSRCHTSSEGTPRCR